MVEGSNVELVPLDLWTLDEMRGVKDDVGAHDASAPDVLHRFALSRLLFLESSPCLATAHLVVCFATSNIIFLVNIRTMKFSTAAALFFAPSVLAFAPAQPAFRPVTSLKSTEAASETKVR